VQFPDTSHHINVKDTENIPEGTRTGVLLSDFEFNQQESNNFVKIGQKIGQLVSDKNIAYGNSVVDAGKILAIIYPNGISIDQYDDALLVVRILDKIKRIANDKNAFNEDPWMDIAGYGILGVNKENEKK